MAARTYSRDEAANLFHSAWATLRPWCDSIDPVDYDRASALAGWTVRDILVHIGSAMLVLPALTPAPKGTVAWSAGTFVGTYSDRAEQIAESTRTRTVEVGDDVLSALDAAFDRAATALEQHPADGVGHVRSRPIRISDFLLTRVLELVVHGDDVARSLSIDPPPFGKDVMRATVRMLLDALAEAHPGGTVEVRVPPFAAVQCIAGPRHTRGTPPNVVETDPWTWIRLAAGRTTWSRERAEHRVTASGQRADLSEVLPLF